MCAKVVRQLVVSSPIPKKILDDVAYGAEGFPGRPQVSEGRIGYTVRPYLPCLQTFVKVAEKQVIYFTILFSSIVLTVRTRRIQENML